MKKLLLLLTCITWLVYPTSYNTLSSDLKEQLCAGRLKMVSQREYMTFIEKYVPEAEENLAILNVALKIGDINDHDASLLRTYLNNLWAINKLTLDNLVMPNKVTKQRLQFDTSQLLEKIITIKETWNLDIDPEIELKNSIALLDKINNDFIKQLGKFQLLNIRMIQRWKYFKESMYLGACGLQYTLFKVFMAGMNALC